MAKRCKIATCLFILATAAILYQPIENPKVCYIGDLFEHKPKCYFCWLYKLMLLSACKVTESLEGLCAMAWDSLYMLKCSIITCKKDDTEEVDKVIEDEITAKLGEDLFESLEMKFQDDLAKSINMVLLKVKQLLQNGTNHIVDGLQLLQNELESLKDTKINKACIKKMHNKTQAIAESALHEMIICAYSLIGQDPSEAILKVVQIKRMISENMLPIRKQKPHIYELMRMCGHNHDSLKKVVKCVISKSPAIKSMMMETTQKIISGVTELTKLVAHGAMHEACLIEVIKSVELEALQAITDAKSCNLEKSQ